MGQLRSKSKQNSEFNSDARNVTVGEIIYRALFTHSYKRFCTPLPLGIKKSSSSKKNLMHFIANFMFRLVCIGLLAANPFRNQKKLANRFVGFYSDLLLFAEQSLSVPGFEAITSGHQGFSAIANLNRFVAHLWKMPFGRIAPGGASGAMLTVLTGVLPKISGGRSIVLVDCLAHQSTFGGIMHGRFKYCRIPRSYQSKLDTFEPIRIKDIRYLVEYFGEEKIAGVVLVTPSYDGFRDIAEEREIVTYLREHGILSIFDTAWGSAVVYAKSDFPEFPQPDFIVSSPHKKSQSGGSDGVICCLNEHHAKIIDRCGCAGFNSTSVSYVTLMVTQFRLMQIETGELSDWYAQAAAIADTLGARVHEIHPRIRWVRPSDVGATHGDPTHLLLNTQGVGLDARLWADELSRRMGIICEKSTRGNMLLLVGNNVNIRDVEVLLCDLKISLEAALQSTKIEEIDYAKAFKTTSSNRPI